MHSRNSVRYYLLIATLLIFFFFSNDFGIIDIQKTALVLAVGVDREDNQFIVTTQIAVPQSSAQGKDAQAVQMESRGETVADALNQINIKTGWYPKLVFCNLVVLGEGTVRQNVFDALDFFLRDEYMSDRCLVAACEGTAKEILDTVTPIDPISSGTRKEELLMDPQEAPLIWGVRRILANTNSTERAMDMLIKSLKQTNSNQEFLLRMAKKMQAQQGRADDGMEL